jgi:hypothetical protein
MKTNFGFFFNDYDFAVFVIKQYLASNGKAYYPSANN